MEGPSLHLLAEELQPFVEKKIIKVAGNAHFEKDVLNGQTIKELYAFGKRLIIQLDTHAIITHFLMYGSYRVDIPKPAAMPRFALATRAHSLFLYNCSTKCVHDSNLKKSLPLTFDILSPAWDSNAVIKAIQNHPTATIDDILLDQNIFAGVGNIIKNEVLFMSNVPPQKKVKQLSLKKLKEIASNARTFSQNFLEWRKIFQLKKHLKIYRKKECPECSRPVLRKKTGLRNRWSFYCPRCQK